MYVRGDVNLEVLELVGYGGNRAGELDTSQGESW